MRGPDFEPAPTTTSRSLPGFHRDPYLRGRDQVEPLLSQADIAVCLLSLTAETERIFCGTFAMMPNFEAQDSRSCGARSCRFSRILQFR